MTSDRKIQSNRRNASRSTGPVSKRGKKHSSGNALKTGLFAAAFPLETEDVQAYERLSVDLKEKYLPVGSIEETLVQLISDDIWRLSRMRLIETECLIRVRENRIKHEIRKLSDEHINRLIDENSARVEDQSHGDDDLYGAAAADGQPKVGGFPEMLTGGEPKEVYAEAMMRVDAIYRTGDTLLEAYISRMSETPMADIDQQRRRVTRDLLQNIAALKTIQDRRKTVLARANDACFNQ